MSNTVNTIDPHQGRKLNMAGGDYRIIVSGKETNGTYAIIEMTVPAGAGPVPHAHPGFEEIFYVVEGEVDFKTAAGSFLAQKGATVSIPKGGAYS
jgi:quercetin dioxygenase-like cupin family protein